VQFHNTDTYYTSQFLHGLRVWISRRFQLCFPLFWGRWGTPLPNNVQLTVAIGRPVPFPAGWTPPPAAGADGKRERVSVPEEVVSAYQQAYLGALQATFEAHKAQAGYPPERKLVIRESA
jgi:hypothetical protein